MPQIDDAIEVVQPEFAVEIVDIRLMWIQRAVAHLRGFRVKLAQRRLKTERQQKMMMQIDGDERHLIVGAAAFLFLVPKCHQRRRDVPRAEHLGVILVVFDERLAIAQDLEGDRR